jgi:putative tryptophan/tyrosine transport system substrate-binding protein
VEGQNLAIEYRWAEGQSDRLPALAAELVRRQVNAIVTTTFIPALAAKAATTTIPIVFQGGSDPVRAGLVASPSRPGGNITGVTNITVDLAAKRLDLLHKAVPNATTIGILIDPTILDFQATTTELQTAARVLRLRVIILNVSSEGDFDAAFASLVQQGAGALLLTDTVLFNNWRERLVVLAARYAIPTIYTFREFAVEGGLMSYASSLADAFRLTGIYTARILKGEKPADIPVWQPTKVEFVLNLKTATELGLDIPPGVLAIADEVIN